MTVTVQSIRAFDAEMWFATYPDLPDYITEYLSGLRESLRSQEVLERDLTHAEMEVDVLQAEVYDLQAQLKKKKPGTPTIDLSAVPPVSPRMNPMLSP